MLFDTDLYPHDVGVIIVHHLVSDGLQDVGGVVIRKLKQDETWEQVAGSPGVNEQILFRLYVSASINILLNKSVRWHEIYNTFI